MRNLVLTPFSMPHTASQTGTCKYEVVERVKGASIAMADVEMVNSSAVAQGLSHLHATFTMCFYSAEL